MLHDRKGDEQLEQSIGVIRRQLASAKERVAALYPGARINWVLETRQWVVVDAKTRETIEASAVLDELAKGAPAGNLRIGSGTHRRTDTE